MKRKYNKAIFCFSAIYVLVFVIDTLYDYVRYDSMLNSAPFSAFVLVNAIECLLPGALLAGLGFLLKRKYEKDKKE